MAQAPNPPNPDSTPDAPIPAATVTVASAPGPADPDPTNRTQLAPEPARRLRHLERAGLPQLPPELSRGLSQRDQRAVIGLCNGATWAATLTAMEAPPAYRSPEPPPHVQRAADWLTRELARRCGIDRAWILSELVDLYKWARENGSKDARGGATAAKCLELLGYEAGMFVRSRPQGAGRIPTADVAQLLAAVASRGKPPLLIEQSAAVQHGAQAPDPAGGAAQHEREPRA